MHDYDPKSDGAFAASDVSMSYGNYLKLNEVLSAQTTLSTAHDELLFIIQHQTSELWLKLAIHELRGARDALLAQSFEPAFKMLARVARIFEQLNSAWDVLRTMTPSEYQEFRAILGRSSGFQSAQYREIEFILGNRNRNMLKPHADTPATLALLENELRQPSLYDAAIEILEDMIPTHSPPQEKWIAVYRDPQTYWTLYQLGEKLVDLEDYFRRWRFNHLTTVSRIIGTKRGTGGTRGVNYLKRMLDVVLFPDLWEIRAEL